MDYIVVAPRAPHGGSVNASHFCIEGGGLTGTSIAAAARLGARTTMLGRLGDDEVGDQIVRSLADEGVDTSGLIRVPGGKSLVSVVVVDERTGERTIYSRLDIGVECPTDLIDLRPIRGADVVLLDPHWKEGAILVATEARAAGAVVICDANNPLRHQDLLALCHCPILSRSAALRLAEGRQIQDALRVIRDLGPPVAVITCGEEGAYYSDGREDGYVPAFNVDVVDTTGAGDVFHGAFAVGLARGWSTRDCTIFASAVAALKCTKVGGRAGIPSFEDTIRFLAELGIRMPCS